MVLQPHEWTEKEEERQDYVDNVIQHTLDRLAGTGIEWDMENIAEVRETIHAIIVDKLSLMTSYDFYPYEELEYDAVENPDYKPDNTEMIVTDEQLVTAMKQVLEDIDADELGVLAGDWLGGLCWYTNDGLYSFIPDERYCGGLDFTKE